MICHVDRAKGAYQEVEVLNPEDTSWIDQSMTNDEDHPVRVKVMQQLPSGVPPRRPNVGQLDFDGEVRVHSCA